MPCAGRLNGIGMIDILDGSVLALVGIVLGAAMITLIETLIRRHMDGVKVPD